MSGSSMSVGVSVFKTLNTTEFVIEFAKSHFDQKSRGTFSYEKVLKRTWFTPDIRQLIEVSVPTKA